MSMKRALLNDPEHWRSRAEEARTIAECIKDPEARRQMFFVAESYESIARTAEKIIITLDKYWASPTSRGAQIVDISKAGGGEGNAG
jgi:hypothetical protein